MSSMSTYSGDAEETHKPPRNAQSLLSFFATPSLESTAIDKHSPSFYRGFHTATFHDDPQLKDKLPVQTTFFGSFMSQFLLSAIPIGVFFLMLRFVSKLMRSDAGDMFRQMIDPPRSFLSSKSMKRNTYPVVDITNITNATAAKPKTSTQITFDDIIGIDEAKEEVRQYVRFLNKPEIFTRIGARLPKGCLLTGPSGTGKTLIVKAIASEANVPLYSATGADFINVYLGSGPKMIRQFFEEARQNAPSIVFIDEIAAVGDRKTTSDSGGGMEDNRTINQLLKELDGLHFTSSQVGAHSSPPIIVFAATNYAENIDQALLRAGRFDRKIIFPMPDKEARADLFRYYLSKTALELPMTWNASRNAPLPIAQKKLLGELADLSSGLSPAAISTAVNESCLAAAEDSTNTKQSIGKQHIIDALEKVLLGKQGVQSQQQSPKSNQSEASVIGARQECARALIAWIFPQENDVLRISIGKRANGQFKGQIYTLQKEREASDPMTYLNLFSSMCVSLAPTVSESIFDTKASQHLTPNTQSDAKKATANVLNQIFSFGMVPKAFGMLSLKDGGNRTQGQEEALMSSHRHAEAEKIADERLHFARDIVTNLLIEKKDLLLRLEEALLSKGALGFDDISTILGARPTSLPMKQEIREKVYALYSGCMA